MTLVFRGAGEALPTLRSERLCLRQWRAEDHAPFAALNADARVTRFLGSALDRAQSDALAHRIQDEMRRRGFGLWAAERTDLPDRPFIGFIGLAVPRFEAAFTPCVEVGYRLASEHWGLGLATEGARRVLEFAFQELQLEAVVSFTTRTNAASRRVMEKLGLRYQPDEDFEHPSLAPDHPLRPHVLYRIVAAEWFAARG